MNWLELHSDHIVVDPREGPTLEVMKQYAGHIFKFRVRHSSAGREGRSESSNNHVRKRGCVCRHLWLLLACYDARGGRAVADPRVMPGR